MLNIHAIIVRHASFWARLVLRIRKPLIIGVTGSVGKTTTTEMIAAVLARPHCEALLGRVGKTTKSMNDDIGVPMCVLLSKNSLTCNRWSTKAARLCAIPLRAVFLALSTRYPRVLVLEYGTHRYGHLHRLADLAPPNIAVVTTIGPAHLERLKTLEGVVREKSALVRAVPPSGLVVLGDNHSFVSDLERLSAAPVIKVSGRGVELSRNIARTIGRHFGIPDQEINAAFDEFKMPPRRLNRAEVGGLTIIDDTYNANPLSMRLALDTLTATAASGRRRVAILGGMGELGDESRKHHEEIAAYARDRCDVLIGVGELAKAYSPDHWFPNSEACASEVQQLLSCGDCVLVKGSASVHMAQVARMLLKPHGMGLVRAPEPTVRSLADA
jgi:UDP-N-acetylmuramoyl-tripeptide--D-alanyl-D-alanine ligase